MQPYEIIFHTFPLKASINACERLGRLADIWTRRPYTMAID